MWGALQVIHGQPRAVARSITPLLLFPTHCHASRYPALVHVHPPACLLLSCSQRGPPVQVADHERVWVFEGQPGSTEWLILEEACAELDKLWILVNQKLQVRRCWSAVHPAPEAQGLGQHLHNPARPRRTAGGAHVCGRC